MKSIGIVGAGLMGRLTALTLHRHGFKVTLFDKDSQAAHNSAAYAAAGLLTPLGEAISSEKNIVDMGFESLKLWPELLKTLDEYVFFQQKGALMVSHEQDKGDYLRILRYLQNHYPEANSQQVNREQLQQLEPELGRSFHQGLFLPDEGQIGNRRLLIALKKQLISEGINWLCDCEVSAIMPKKNGATLHYQLNGNKAQSAFDLVIDCRGLGAKSSKQKDSVNQLKNLRGVRGELFQLFAPEVKLSRPVRLMHPRYQLYIAPKDKGFYVVGATQIESDDNSPMTVRSAMELLSAAYSVHPGFAEANIRQHVSQCRPAFDDNQPKITLGKHVIQINGLYRHGFLIAPVLLKQIEQLTLSLATHNSRDFLAQPCQISQYLSEQNFQYSHLQAITAHEQYSH
ncbi:glycine oxidase ThiO [Thalassotalea sp. PLHSN55]|uniref:glycine oxidase ThiO n=1 Tax=Thalassotalea sp. PLHSN55 TaxID=3435888 RepID=UPI003F84E571